MDANFVNGVYCLAFLYYSIGLSTVILRAIDAMNEFINKYL